MEKEKIGIAIAIFGIIALLVGIGIGIYAGNNQGEITTKNLLQPQIDKLIQENASLKSKVETETMTQQLLETTKAQLIEQQRLNEPLQQKEKTIREIAMKCYWAFEYLADPQGTIEHWEGKDYTQYYAFKCRELSQENWEIMKSTSE